MVVYKTLVNFQNKLNNIGISFKVYADNEILYIKKLIKNEKIDNFTTMQLPDLMSAN